MTVLERIKQLCKEKKNISITTLEQELRYSNGSLAKAKDIPSSRIMEIAEYLGVSMDYLMTGKTTDNKELAVLDVKLSTMDNTIKEYALKLNKLTKEQQDLVMKMIDQLGE